MDTSRFPNRLKKYRRLFCLSQKQVAAVLGLPDTSTLCRWEKGITLPNLIVLFKLARLYKALPTEMYGELWQESALEVSGMDENLLTQHESFITN